jgi:hypothetical protein
MPHYCHRPRVWVFLDPRELPRHLGAALDHRQDPSFGIDHDGLAHRFDEAAQDLAPQVVSDTIANLT